MTFRGLDAAASPVTTALVLVGAAIVLVGGFYCAGQLAEGAHVPPKVGIWSDDANDRLLVVLGDTGADWRDLEVRTSAPARVRLDGQADAVQGTLSPGAQYVPLAVADEGIVGGDALSLCALGTGGKVDVSLRDADSNAIVFEQTLSVRRCATPA